MRRCSMPGVEVAGVATFLAAVGAGQIVGDLTSAEPTFAGLEHDRLQRNDGWFVAEFLRHRRGNRFVNL